ncbi:MAG: N-succinylarginine dihydrolase [Pseudomonadales bacterium]|nr:N-succinylarginine dihydrolase [Pseudomonadales bacterium]
MNYHEVNFDGLVGPTHNYAGLSFGNVASQSHKQAASNPKAAALQGLAKMKALVDRGFKQAVLPPQERPSIAWLQRLGFTGSDAEILAKAARETGLLPMLASASCMWAANAATVSPSPDCRGGKVHFTAANLSANLHRAIESRETVNALKTIFHDPIHFAHHEPLPGAQGWGDEGAANHSRLCATYGHTGVEMFVYGARADSVLGPTRYPARQTLQACQAIARLHALDEKRVVMVQQNPAVIDMGVFHNDVIAVANQRVLLYHEDAFLDTQQVLDELNEKLREGDLIPVKVPRQAVSVADAVKSYLFNSQLLTIPGSHAQNMIILLPEESKKNRNVAEYINSLIAADNPITEAMYFDLHQSMQNGGGPACLRLRVVLNDAQWQAINQGVVLNDTKYRELCNWVERHYRDELLPKDLADPALLNESRTALDELTKILNLGSFYPFQLGSL